MIYTSGTTGKPKGAVRSGPPDPEVLGALLNLFGYRPDDIYLTSGPLYHSGPSAFMSAGLLFGQTIIVQRRFDAEDWLRLVDTYQVTSTFSAPALIRMICALPGQVKDRYDRSSMRVMIANAAPWSYALKQQYVADFPPESLFEVYGSTELGVDTVLMPEDQMRKPGSCGTPAPGIEIMLVDATTARSPVPGRTTPARFSYGPRSRSTPTTRTTPAISRTAAAAITRSATSPTGTTRATCTSATARPT